MTLSVDVAKSFLGKNIMDAYGRVIGRIVGLFSNAESEVSSFEIELGNGEFSRYSSHQILIDGDSAIFVYSWKIDFETLKKEFDVTTRKIGALDKLYSNGEISKEVCEEIRKQHETALNELMERRSVLLEVLKDRNKKLTTQIKELQSSLANIKIEHMTGGIDDQAYNISNSSIQSGLNRALSEKKDIEATIDTVTKLSEVKPPTPPIVLRIKNGQS